MRLVGGDEDTSLLYGHSKAKTALTPLNMFKLKVETHLYIFIQ